MAKHRTHSTHSIAFKRQVVQEYLAGETLHGLARRHDLSRTLIRIWVDKYEAGVAEHLPRFIDSCNERRLHSALGDLSPKRFEEEQPRKPVKSAA